MLELQEFQQTLMAHQLTAAGPIPSVCDPDGVYPYPSFVETSRRPSLRRYRFVALENDFLRVAICPDLGGKVHSITDKRSGHEALFVPVSIQPVRVLPRFGFIPGGIEVSFPISHTPVQLDPVDFQSAWMKERLYLWCGERELHFGMQWTVEYSLGERDTFLTQRTLLRNPTTREHPWMSWSNAAVPARADTEFHFPNGPVLAHGAKLEVIDWSSQGPRRVADLDRMSGFFWQAPNCAAFGAFTPSLGQGLYHIANPSQAPGIKLWSYGTGQHEDWGRAGSLSGETYLELQGGPMCDQSIKETLQPGESRSHLEFWLPSPLPLDIQKIQLPQPALADLVEVPWFDWPPRPGVHYWRSVMAAFDRRAFPDLPPPLGCEDNLWAPAAMESLGEALRWAASKAPAPGRDGWLFQLGAWLAGRGRVEEALTVLDDSNDDRARALAGRLHLRARKDARLAAAAFRSIADEAIALHPQVMVERDLALAEAGEETLRERELWLARLSNSQDEWLVERRAALSLDRGRPEEARAHLEGASFQLVHQRYARSALWNRIREALSLAEPEPPAWLGEDDLAAFGAYREHENGPGK